MEIAIVPLQVSRAEGVTIWRKGAETGIIPGRFAKGTVVSWMVTALVGIARTLIQTGTVARLFRKLKERRNLAIRLRRRGRRRRCIVCSVGTAGQAESKARG